MKNTGISEITSEGSIIKTFCQIQSSVLFLLKFIYLFIYFTNVYSVTKSMHLIWLYFLYKFVVFVLWPIDGDMMSHLRKACVPFAVHVIYTFWVADLKNNVSFSFSFCCFTSGN